MRILRIAATFLAFAAFSLVSVLLGAVVAPLLHLVIRRPRTRVLCLRHLVRRLFRLFLACLGFTGVLRSGVQDGDLIGGIRGAVVAVNHPTLLDYVLMISCMDEHTAVVYKSSLAGGFMGRIIRSLDYVSSDDLGDCGRHLEEGDSILIFPEGSRSRGRELKFTRGAAQVAVRHHVPVHVLCLRCDSPGYLGSGFFSLRLPDRTPRLELGHVCVLDPRSYGPRDDGDPARPGILARRLTADMERVCIAALGDGPLDGGTEARGTAGRDDEFNTAERR